MANRNAALIVLAAAIVISVGANIYQALNPKAARTIRTTTPPPDAEAGCSNTCYPFLKYSFTGMKGTLAKELVENYRRQQWLIYRANTHTSNTPTGIADTRAVWFSVERLKNFLYEVEQSACNPACRKERLELGVRFYLGTYPMGDEKTIAGKWQSADLDLEKDGVPYDYAGHTTLVLVPTYYDGTHDVDFDPLHWKKGNCLPDPIDSAFKLSTTTAFLVPTKLANHGGANPPPDDLRVLQNGDIDYNITPFCNGASFMNAVDGLPCH